MACRHSVSVAVVPCLTLIPVHSVWFIYFCHFLHSICCCHSHSFQSMTHYLLSPLSFFLFIYVKAFNFCCCHALSSQSMTHYSFSLLSFLFFINTYFKSTLTWLLSFPCFPVQDTLLSFLSISVLL